MDSFNELEGDEDEELGDTLETALKLNRAYQELLRFHMDNIKSLLDQNLQKQVTAFYRYVVVLSHINFGSLLNTCFCHKSVELYSLV